MSKHKFFTVYLSSVQGRLLEEKVDCKDYKQDGFEHCQAIEDNMFGGSWKSFSDTKTYMVSADIPDSWSEEQAIMNLKNLLRKLNINYSSVI